MNFDLTILGSGSALPTSRRYSTAHALNVHERFFLIDCGEGVQVQLRNAKVKFSRLNHIFISHLHGDHTFGLFGLLSSFNLLGRKHDLNLFGPVGLKKIIDFYLENFAEYLDYQIVFHPITTRSFNLIHEDKGVEVYSFPLKHRVPAWGYLFKEKEKESKVIKGKILEYNLSIEEIVKIKKGADWVSPMGTVVPNSELTIPPDKPRSYAFCSDTSYYERIVKWVEGVDLLYHEATFAQNDKKIAKQTGHSTTLEAATIAKKADVKKLVIGHYSNRYKHLEPLLTEARTVFSETYLAKDLDIHQVK